jgi:hypothetical protein
VEGAAVGAGPWNCGFITLDRASTETAEEMVGAILLFSKTTDGQSRAATGDW